VWLNQRVPRHHKYHLLDPRRGSSSGFFLRVLVLLILAVGIWMWWDWRKSRAPRLRPRLITPATNQVAPSKPVFVPSPANVIAPPKTGQPPVKVVSPATPPGVFPHPARDVFEAQLALARDAISPGPLDGVIGSQTRAALLAFQRKAGLPETLELDGNTRARLVLETPPLTTYTVTSNDLARLQPLSNTWLGKSQQTALDYETILELVAEKGRASPNLIRRLNPAIDWTNVVAETEIQIPDVNYPEPRERAGFAVISLAEKKLEVFDTNTEPYSPSPPIPPSPGTGKTGEGGRWGERAAKHLLAHFPCSIAARVEKRPAGELHVAAIAPNPNYTFDPDVFPESAEARQLNRKLILPPGTNNPVGTAWISLDRVDSPSPPTPSSPEQIGNGVRGARGGRGPQIAGYGMHGTPSPEQVGRTESHGCFRLANWDAEYLVKLVWVGMPVYIEP
jgi:peptidoglycan hydrolase-like protein with peptidoglycan-binding domain